MGDVVAGDEGMNGSMGGLNTGGSTSLWPCLIRLFGSHHRTALILALLASPVSAQEPTPLRWSAHEAIPSRISDVLVGTNLALDGWYAFRDENHRARWAFACRTGLTYGVTEVLKRLIGRERPNGRDQFSMPSGHTAFATSSAGYRSPLGASFALAVAWGRQAGGWHYATDTAFGAGIGWGASWLCDEAVIR